MKKRFALAVIVITAISLSLVGCGVKVTNISVPDAATLCHEFSCLRNAISLVICEIPSFFVCQNVRVEYNEKRKEQ